jgi:DNA helicase-2/ATP-dependent DNA helicase PcrA
MGRRNWEREVSLLDLTYKLVTWLPSMQNDIEGLVYLEAITRTISQAGLTSPFQSKAIFNPAAGQRNVASVKAAIDSVFLPMSLGSIEVNEDLLETIPLNRLSIMSIHQAKGLEFPVVIVDVGSEFTKRHVAQAFKRYPEDGGKTCNIEDYCRPASVSIAASRQSSRDRAFDDLIRKFYVSYSRAQDVLILAGLTSVRDGYRTKAGPQAIPNVATGWNRNNQWIWGNGLANLVQI